MNLHALPQDLLPYVSLFSQSLLEIGTETEDFVKLTQRIGRKTGGIHPATFTSASRTSVEAVSWLFLRGKATTDQADDLLDILRDILLTVRLDNKERFVQMLLEQKAGQEASLVPAGHRVAVARLRAKLDEASWASEQMGGVTQLFALRQMAEQVQGDWPAVLAKLEEIRRILVNRSSMVCNVTLDAANWAHFRPRLEHFLDSLPFAPAECREWVPEFRRYSEGLTLPANVNFVAKGASLHDFGFVPDGAASVVTRYLARTWLHERIRAQGGAYGAYCVLDPHGGLLIFASYRDPNLRETLETYDGSSDFLRQLELTEDDLVKSIITTIGDMDSYQLPDAKGHSALRRHLIGYTSQMRQKHRNEVLATTAAHYGAFAAVLDSVRQEGLVVAMGSQDAIKNANDELGGALQLTKIA
jgi:Zn-dependent M16 (insulinase) family peptidase